MTMSGASAILQALHHRQSGDNYLIRPLRLQPTATTTHLWPSRAPARHPARTTGAVLTEEASPPSIPPRLETIGAPVLISQRISVLPNVVAEQNPPTFHRRRILIVPIIHCEKFDS